jgi:uncharacterized protein YcbK (DUF882 family)
MSLEALSLMAYDPDYGWFLPSETRCKCGCGLDIKPEFRTYLNAVREEYGAPLHLTSGARCATYNDKVGGVPNSYHIKGVAADIRWPKDQREARRLLLILAQSAGGLGIYETFVHVDARLTRDTLWINP